MKDSVIVESKQELDEGAEIIERRIAIVSKEPYTEIPLYWLRFRQSELPNQSIRLKAITQVLTDPLQEELWFTDSAGRAEWVKIWHKDGFRWWAEKQFAPGVTDNLGHTVKEALQL